MSILLNDNDKCVCGAYWQGSGFCANGHNKTCKDGAEHDYQPTDTEGHHLQCSKCANTLSQEPQPKKDSDKELTGKTLYMLNQKYSRQFGWSTFFEVHLGKRRADFVAFNIYPSRGFPIIGCEIKASRSDWLAELKDCGKADSIIKNCDEWYIVEAKKDIVRKDELPAGWGLISPSGRGLAVRVKSNLPKAVPSREFVARVIEHTLYAKGGYPSEMLYEAERRGRESMKGDYVEKHKFDRAQEKADVLDKLKANGIDFYLWRLGDIKKVKLAMELLEHLEAIEYRVKQLGDGYSDLLAKINETQNIMQEVKSLKGGVDD